MFSHKKAVIFDLDGTLINSLDVWNLVDIELMKELVGECPDLEALGRFRQDALWQCRDMVNPYEGYSALLAQWLGINLTGKEVHCMRFGISRRLLRTHVTLREGAAKSIRFFQDRGMKLAIATTTRRCNVDLYCQYNENIRAEVKLARSSIRF